MKALAVVQLTTGLPRFVIFDHETTEDTVKFEKAVRKLPNVVRAVIVKSHIADDLLTVSDQAQALELLKGL